MKYLDIAFKLLSMLVIPLVLWGVSLEVRLAVQDTVIQRLQVDITETQNVASRVRDSANTNALALGRMEEKLNAVDKNIVEIKGLLQRR